MLYRLPFGSKEPKENLNVFVTAFKNRKLPSQVLFLNLNGKDENLKKFAVTLHSQRNVSALTLYFKEGPELTKQMTKFLILKLGRMYLSELKISFGFYDTISAKCLSPLFSGLKNLTWLSSLTLDLRYKMLLKLVAIKELVLSLKGIRRLERLRISIKDSLIEGKAIEELLSGLGKLKHISHLSFDISPSMCHNFYDASSFNNVSTMLTSLKCLTSLELILNFPGSDMESLIITYISSGLRSLTSLKNLTLSLFPRSPRIMECGAKNLSEALREMKSLQKLDLHFSVREFTKEYQDKLSSGFKDLKMLKHLSLFLKFDKVSEEEVESFSLAFENLKALNVLQLKFADSTKFDKKIIPILYENLKRVNPLIHFYLEIHTKEKLETIEKKKFISKFGKENVKLIGGYENKWNLSF